ncbi:MAG: helix-turn-helix transcriptional regulator [Pseudomonadota bacterium]
MDDYSEDAATFGDRLALAREGLGLSQAQLARRLGLRVQTVRNWEGDRSEPRANKLQMLAGFLNVSMVWLMTGEGAGGPSPAAAPAEEAPAGLHEALAEIRDLRVLQTQITDRLARLEKRLRLISKEG